MVIRHHNTLQIIDDNSKISIGLPKSLLVAVVQYNHDHPSNTSPQIIAYDSVTHSDTHKTALSNQHE